MADHTEKAAAWIYRGVWSGLTRWFNVPGEPPHVPAGSAAVVESFKPSPNYLRYRKLWFWILLALTDFTFALIWVIIAFASPLAGAILFLPALALIILPDVVFYIALHLRYDTTWYVLTDRSMRIRRGIWLIHETTITYENIQNVSVRQGPVQRRYGIADVLVHTAGGGAPQAGGGGGAAMLGAHLGHIEGIENAAQLREQILERAKASRSAGLGDERAGHEEMTHSANGTAWTARHIDALRAIRDELRRRVNGDGPPISSSS